MARIYSHVGQALVWLSSGDSTEVKELSFVIMIRVSIETTRIS